MSVKIPDGFDLAKYKKMVRLRMPEASVRNRIRQDGFDEKLFETLVLRSPSPAKHEPDIPEGITPRTDLSDENSRDKMNARLPPRHPEEDGEIKTSKRHRRGL